MFYVSPTNWQREEEFVAYHIHEWDDHWKALNASFEEALNADEDLQKFSGGMFYVWDNNHQLQAWMPYISRVHPNDLSWHIVVDTKEGLIHLLTEQIRFKLNTIDFKVLVLFCF